MQAEVYGDYAVHIVLHDSPPDYDVYTVSHIPSGLMVAFTEVLDDARGCAQDMNGHNIEDQIKAVRKREVGGLLKKPWFVKLLTQYHMGVYISRGSESKTRPIVYFGR